MRKTRQYRRSLTKEQKTALRRKYADLLESKRGGCLGSYAREWLLGMKAGKEMDESEQKDYETKTWSRIKQTSRDALTDFCLICEVADDKMLSSIFFEKDKNTGISPFVSLMQILFQNAVENNADRAWRKAYFEEFICRALYWFIKSGVLKTPANNRAVMDAMETIGIVSSGTDWTRRFEFEEQLAIEAALAGGFGPSEQTKEPDTK